MNLKDLILTKLESNLEKIKTERVSLKNYNEIKKKFASNVVIFFHPIYSRVKNKFYSQNNIEYLNEEEDTDFLVFEDNLVFVDYSENLFTFHKVLKKIFINFQIDEEEILVKVDLDNNSLIEKEVDGNDDLSQEVF